MTADDTTHEPDRTGSLALPAIGTVQGIVCWAVYTWLPESGEARAYCMALLAFTTVVALSAQFAWTGQDHGRLALAATALGLVFAAPTAWVWLQLPGSPSDGDHTRTFTWICAAFVALYVLLPYVQIFQGTGRLRFPYPALFFHSWNNFFIGVTGMIYTSVLGTLLELWGALFKLIGIGLFQAVFHSTAFVAIVHSTVFAFGISRGRENARVIDATRGAMLAVFRFLLPLLAAISLMFLGTLPFTGVGPLWETGYGSHLVLTVVAFAVLFLNAVFEDGRGSPPYPTPVRRLVETAVALLPIFAMLAIYGIGLRVSQHGLTIERFYGVVFTVVFSLYALGYAPAVLSHAPWMGRMRGVNVALSFVVAAIALFLHTPIMDPLAWSARNQRDRLAEGRVAAASFDYAYLHFSLGHAGARALADLESLDGHAEIATIRRGIKNARAAESYYVAKRRPSVVEEVELIPPLERLPDGLLAAIQVTLTVAEREACDASRQCQVFAVALDADPPSEYCVLTATAGRAVCFAGEPDRWSRIGTLQVPVREIARRESLHALLRDQPPVPVSRRYGDVKIGDVILHFQPAGELAD